MDPKIRIGIIDYLNVKPFIYGLQNNPVAAHIELVKTYPAALAEKLLNNSIDLSIVPVAALPDMEEKHIISDYCIGCVGKVASVCLFSEVPLNQIETVILDYQSRTSIALVQILFKKYWKVNPVFKGATGEDYRNDIKGTTAAVVIGDRAFEQRLLSKYIYDLGEAWLDYTGKGFVFAAWVANKHLPQTFVTMLNEALLFGLNNIDKVVEQLHYPHYDLKHYYQENIQYTLDKQKREGLSLFLKELTEPQEF